MVCKHYDIYGGPEGLHGSNAPGGRFRVKVNISERVWRESESGFLSHLYIKVIFLPRQARDKHRENSKKARFVEAHLPPFEACVENGALGTANCIIIDHFSAFESGLVAPFLYAA